MFGAAHFADTYASNVGVSGGNDIFTKLLLHMDTNFSDSSSNNYSPTLINAPSITAVSKFGAGAGSFVAASSQYVTYPDSADWFFGTGNFTIDFWVKLAGTGATYRVYDQTQDVNNRNLFVMSDTAAQFQSIGSSVTLADYTLTYSTLGTAAYHHIAIVRNSTTFLIFIDGVSQTLTVNTAIASNSLPDIAATLAIGAPNGGGGQFLDGTPDEYRISKGIARWTSNFTPPTQAYF